ncbi:hypothetical protein [Marinimicrobium agarilyticum]|uniref:hypothetical protein n=1 Tax=Marinimicrobium agarilyticum TaxID=306546 RepID=UPI00040B76EE|nr:hypothetical protein [Marinimicrobium agarilyticum]
MRTALLTLLLLVGFNAHAQQVPRIEIEMDATTIKANKELPKLLYIIPWKDTELAEATGERKILIPELFGDFYQPVLPGELTSEVEAERSFR